MLVLRLAFLLLVALAALPCRAQTPIHHCIGTDGHPVFTDQPCASLHATPAPAASNAAPSLRPPAVTCAANVDELRQATIDAFADADANRLAGLMLWDGYGERAAVADIHALARLMRQPLIGIAAPDDPSAPGELVVRTLPDDNSGEHQVHFAIERHDGCLWLRPSG